MKQINVYFDDDEHDLILKAKGNQTWRQMILKMAKELEPKEKEEGEKLYG